VTQEVSLREGLYQLAYLVPDLNQAMAEFTRRLGAGPWLRLDNFSGRDQRWNGEPYNRAFNIAFGQAGLVQIELIELPSSGPSPYHDHLKEHGFGLQHLGFLTADFDAAVASHERDGEKAVFTACTPSGGRVAHMKKPGAIVPICELIEIDDGLITFFGAIKAAASNWDGKTPFPPMSQRV
jgi:hypothetical protein